jgi:hypothetical protein
MLTSNGGEAARFWIGKTWGSVHHALTLILGSDYRDAG